MKWILNRGVCFKALPSPEVRETGCGYIRISPHGSNENGVRTGRDGDPKKVPEPPVVWNQFIRLRPVGISKLKDVRSTRTAAIINVGWSTYHDCAFTHVHGPSKLNLNRDRRSGGRVCRRRAIVLP